MTVSKVETLLTPASKVRSKNGASKSVAATLLLAHGAGAPMTSPFMEDMAQFIAEKGIKVVRFEFEYMAERRKNGTRRPPSRADNLISEYKNAVSNVGQSGSDGLALFTGGKSMGGRIATMIADDLYAGNLIRGVIALGYPFHPANKPDTLRIVHLENLKCPTLFIQGERDPLGSRDDVASYALSRSIKISWAPDGDHHLCPRPRSGLTHHDNLKAAAQEIATFIKTQS